MSLSVLERVVANNFPQTGLSLAFGYGSKVVRQGATTKSSDLIDIILSVDNPIEWHKANLAVNRQHYSALKYLPDSEAIITRLQEDIGAKVYFNPYVRAENFYIKYGVIKTDHLIQDLNDWTSLYIAGRMHKPVEFIINTCDKNETLRTALRRNKESAVRTALLLLPETFDIYNLFKTITSLSYNGDIRMLFGEDKNKVHNIVTSQMERFNQLYMPLLRLSQTFKDSVHWNESKGTFVQDLSPQVVIKSLRTSPQRLKLEMCKNHFKEAQTLEADAVLLSISRSIYLDKIVSSALSSIVFQSTFPQTAKGLLSAGIFKSLRYAQRKIMKSILSRYD